MLLIKRKMEGIDLYSLIPHLHSPNELYSKLLPMSDEIDLFCTLNVILIIFSNGILIAISDYSLIIMLFTVIWTAVFMLYNL